MGKHAGMELLAEVTVLTEKVERDGMACRVFFAGQSRRTGMIPVSDLLVVFIRQSTRRKNYKRFTKAWPREFKEAGFTSRCPKHLCTAMAGLLDGTLYVGTDEVRWTPVMSGEKRRPVPVGEKGAVCGCTRHDLYERDLRRVEALNPVRLVWHELILGQAKAMYEPQVCGEELEVRSQLQFPRFMASVNLPYQRFRLREDAPNVVTRVEGIIQAAAEGYDVVDESGASVLLRVLKHANEGVWLSDAYGAESAPYTGMYRLGVRSGSIIGYHEAPLGYEGDTEDVEGTKCLPKVDEFPDFSEAVSDELDKFFDGGPHHVRFEPAVGKEWTLVRQNQPLWVPQGVPKRTWTPAELASHPKYQDLRRLAALATVETRNKLAYADLDLTVGTSAWVDLDSTPRVQLVSGSAGLCRYTSGMRCNLARLDIEARIREIREQRLKTK